MGNFNMDGYNTVPQRIAEFRSKHPEGSLRPVDPLQPYRIESVGNKTFIVFTAEAYRTPDDPKPGIGTAWEPFPGPTQFTRDSELQNAETSAWGRAIIATLAADASKGVASGEEIRNRNAEPLPPPPQPISLAEEINEVDEAGAPRFSREQKKAMAAEWKKRFDFTTQTVPPNTVKKARALIASFEGWTQPEESETNAQERSDGRPAAIHIPSYEHPLNAGQAKYKLGVIMEQACHDEQEARREALAVWEKSNYADSQEIGAIEWQILMQLVEQRAQEMCDIPISRPLSTGDEWAITQGGTA